MSAGQDDVELVIDHVVSVSDGGDDRLDNLVTACRNCNGGKGARSLQKAPTSQQVIDRINQGARNLLEQAEALSRAIEARKILEQQIVNIKCDAYSLKCVSIHKAEMTVAIRLAREFGGDQLLEWYRCAADHGIKEWKSIKYVCGIARNVREQQP